MKRRPDSPFSLFLLKNFVLKEKERRVSPFGTDERSALLYVPYRKAIKSGSDMAVEMRQMIHQMDCNVPLEQLLEDFAERSRIEDVEQFAGIFFFYGKTFLSEFLLEIVASSRSGTDRGNPHALPAGPYF